MTMAMAVFFRIHLLFYLILFRQDITDINFILYPTKNIFYAINQDFAGECKLFLQKPQRFIVY